MLDQWKTPPLLAKGSNFIGVIALIAILVMAPGVAIAASRVALVVGNSQYVTLPQLHNPANDAAALAEALRSIGFEVVSVNDGDRGRLMAAIDQFGEISRGAEIALFYFAGHGVQVAGTNYLLPIDSTLSSQEDLNTQGLQADLVIEKLKVAAPRAGIVILDACRDNPLPVSIAGATRGLKVGALTSGLARLDGVSGVLIAYATAPGQVAYDGAGANSPFVAALIRYLAEPGLEISMLFRKVRQQVMESTAGAQIPWVEEALIGSLYIHPAEAQPQIANDVAHLNDALAIEEPEKRLAALIDLGSTLSDPSVRPIVANRIDQLREEQVTESPSAHVVRELVDWHQLRLIKSQPAERLAADTFLAVYPDGIFAPRAHDIQAVTTPSGANNISEADAELLWTVVDKANRPAFFDRFIQLIPAGQFTELARARRTIWLADLTGPGLLPKTDSPAAAPTPPRGVEGSTGVAGAPADTTLSVFIGTDPTKVDLPMTPSLLQVTTAPKYGTLILEHEDGTLAEIRNPDAVPTIIRAMSYRPDPGVRDTVDEFVVAAAEPVGRGLVAPQEPAQLLPMTIRADIKSHECDLEAGARFDTQGVVIGIYANEIKPDRAIPACRQAIATFPDVARFRYQLARALDVAGDNTEAVALLRQAADAGHIVALYELGTHYQSGKGVTADLEAAIHLYREAADRGDLYAATRLGVLYRDGKGVPRDIKTAIDWLVRAARGGHTFAYNHLGYMYLEGNGVEPDYERAYRLFEASANAGDIYGFNNMGVMYERGRFVAADPTQAIAWYEKAARGGQPQAPINLGLIYLGGHGVDADPARAAYWFAEAAKLDNPWGFVNLGRLYQTGKGVDADPELAADFYARALRLTPDGDAATEAAKNYKDLPRKAGIRPIQNRLRSLGFYAGESDGTWGKRTRDAVRAFAEAKHLNLPADTPPIHILASLLDAIDQRATPMTSTPSGN